MSIESKIQEAVREEKVMTEQEFNERESDRALVKTIIRHRSFKSDGTFFLDPVLIVGSCHPQYDKILDLVEEPENQTQRNSHV